MTSVNRVTESKYKIYRLWCCDWFKIVDRNNCRICINNCLPAWQKPPIHSRSFSVLTSANCHLQRGERINQRARSPQVVTRARDGRVRVVPRSRALWHRKPRLWLSRFVDDGRGDRGERNIIIILRHTDAYRSGEASRPSFLYCGYGTHCAHRCPQKIPAGLPPSEGLRYCRVVDWSTPLSTAMVICTHFLCVPSISDSCACRHLPARWLGKTLRV